MPADADASEILELMNDRGIRRIPLVDEVGDLAGIVTLDDMVVLLGSSLRTISELLSDQSPED